MLFLKLAILKILELQYLTDLEPFSILTLVANCKYLEELDLYGCGPTPIDELMILNRISNTISRVRDSVGQMILFTGGKATKITLGFRTNLSSASFYIKLQNELQPYNITKKSFGGETHYNLSLNSFQSKKFFRTDVEEEYPSHSLLTTITRAAPVFISTTQKPSDKRLYSCPITGDPKSALMIGSYFCNFNLTGDEFYGVKVENANKQGNFMLDLTYSWPPGSQVQTLGRTVVHGYINFGVCAVSLIEGPNINIPLLFNMILLMLDLKYG